MKTTHLANPIGVNAARIIGIATINEGLMLNLDDTRTVFANNGQLARYTPIAGDYWVTQDDGYEYVNPKDVFERKYAKVTGDMAGGGVNPHYVPAPGVTCNFCFALEWLKLGRAVARAGWNGKGMFVYLVPANSYPAQTGVAKVFFGDGALVPYGAYLAIKGVDGTVNTWIPSISDLLADDWLFVNLE